MRKLLRKEREYRSVLFWRKLFFRAKHQVKLFLNKSFSASRGFRDYFAFPFDVSSPLPDHAKAAFSSIIQFLEAQDIDYFVADGTLLGIYRDLALIKHDTDLDFYLKDERDVWKICDFFESQGFHVGRVMTRWTRTYQISFYDDRRLIVDFCIWHSDSRGNRFWVAPEIHGKRIQSEIFFNNINVIQWEGLAFRTFSNVEDWLLSVYGENWSVPETEKGDWRESVQDFEG